MLHGRERRGRAAGFSVTVADEDAHDELMTTLRGWLFAHQHLLDDLSTYEAECTSIWP